MLLPSACVLNKASVSVLIGLVLVIAPTEFTVLHNLPPRAYSAQAAEFYFQIYVRFRGNRRSGRSATPGQNCRE